MLCKKNSLKDEGADGGQGSGGWAKENLAASRQHPRPVSESEDTGNPVPLFTGLQMLTLDGDAEAEYGC